MVVEEKKIIVKEMAEMMVHFKKINRMAIKGDGLRQSEAMLLNTIIRCAENDEIGIKPSVLSAKMDITPAAVTHMINSLEVGGYIKRVSDPNDRRVVLIKITDIGNEKLVKRREEFLKELDGFVDFLGEKDSKELIRLVGKAQEYLKNNKNNE